MQAGERVVGKFVFVGLGKAGGKFVVVGLGKCFREVCICRLEKVL